MTSFQVANILSSQVFHFLTCLFPFFSSYCQVSKGVQATNRAFLSYVQLAALNGEMSHPTRVVDVSVQKLPEILLQNEENGTWHIWGIYNIYYSCYDCYDLILKMKLYDIITCRIYVDISCVPFFGPHIIQNFPCANFNLLQRWSLAFRTFSTGI